MSVRESKKRGIKPLLVMATIHATFSINSSYACTGTIASALTATQAFGTGINCIIGTGGSIIVASANGMNMSGAAPTLTVTAGTNVSTTTTGIAVNNTSLGGVITNNGTIQGSGAAIQSVLMAGVGSSLTNSATGTISTATANGTAVGVSANSTINNAGLITATGTGPGITVAASSTSITNSGTISVATGQNIITTGAMVGDINNSGLLTSSGTLGLGVSITTGAMTGSIINSGTIRGLDATTGHGVNMATAVSGGLTNTGLILATGNGNAVVAGANASITNSGTIQAQTGAGISLGGGTTNSNVINNGTVLATSGNGIVTTAAVTRDITNNGTISLSGSGNGIHVTTAALTGTITNNGTISTTGGVGIRMTGNFSVSGGVVNSSTGVITGSVDMSTGVATATNILNAGTITGNVLGSTAGAVTNTGRLVGNVSMTTTGALSNSGTLIGNVTGGAGGNVTNSNSLTGTVTMSGAGILTNTGRITGNVTTGTTFAVNSGTITGNVTGGAAGNITNTGLVTGTLTSSGAGIVANSGTITGLLTIGAAGTLNMTGGSLNVGVAGTSGATTFNFSDGTIVGGITGGSGTDTLNFNLPTSTTERTSTGNIAAVEIVNFNQGVYNLNHLISGATTGVTINSPARINMAADIQGTVTNNGVLSVSGARTITGNYTSAIGSVLQFNITNSTTASSLIVAGNADLTGASTTIRPFILANGYVANNSTFTVLTASGTLSNAATVTIDAPNSAVLTFSRNVATTGVLRLVATRNTYSNFAGGRNSGLAGALEAIGRSGNSSFNSIIGRLDSLRNSDSVSQALLELAPHNGSSTFAAPNATMSGALANVQNRLALVRDDMITSKAAGDVERFNTTWMQVFGTDAKQELREGNQGYKSNTMGVTGGYDRLFGGGNIRGGLAVSYAKSNMRTLGSISTKVDTNSYQATIYGTTRPQGGWTYDSLILPGSGLYFDGMAAYGVNDNEQERQLPTFNQTAKSDYASKMMTAKIGSGYIFKVNDHWQMTPLAAFQYSYLKTNNYTESGSAANLFVSSDAQKLFEGTIGLNTTYRWAQLRTKAIYDFIGSRIDTSSRFTTGGVAFQTTGVKPSQLKFQVGLGARINLGENTAMLLDYDSELKDKYISHTGSLKGVYTF